MNIKERIYFYRMSKYNPIKTAANSIDNAAYLAYYKSRITNVAQEALSGQISSSIAKKEISDLLDNIKEVKKGDK
jgi:hypothetical protein